MEELIDRGPDTLAFVSPLVEDYFRSLHFKHADQWESESSEQMNDRHSRLDEAVLNAFTPSIDPISAIHEIMQVIELARPMMRLNKKRKRTYRQALLSATLITGTSISATVLVYCSKKDNCYQIVIETETSVSVTPILKDVVGPLRPCATANLQGLSGTTEVSREGTVE
jgi:hypothetical protein